VPLLPLDLILLFTSGFKNMRAAKHILFGFIMVMLFTPMLQSLTKLRHEKGLRGAFTLLPKPRLVIDSIFSGSYMNRMNDYVEQNIGFRPTLIRINNQLDYSLYKISHGQGVVIGKNGQLLEEDYITEFLGRNFIGEKTIAKSVMHLKFLQDYLKKEKNIDLIVVLSPSKVRFYEEDIPDRFKPENRSITNYKCFIDNFNAAGLKYINFSSWFVGMKKKAEYPVFPQTGIHWSDYGSLLAFDSIIRYVEAERKIRMPKMTFSRIDMSDTARSVDADLWSVMNLLCYIPHPSLAYPVIEVKDQPGKTRPGLLTIGDSFYWNWFYNAVPGKEFSDPVFWLYNRQVYSKQINGTMFTDKLNIKEEVEKRDVVILMVTERFLYTTFWNFAEDLYKAYNPNPEAEEIVLDYGGRIRGYTEWFLAEIKKAHQENISIETMIDRDAAYSYGEDFKKKANPSRADSLLLYEVRIWGDSTKVAHAQNTANSLKISLAQMIKQKALEQLQTENGELKPAKANTEAIAEKQAAIKEIEKKIRADKNWLLLVKNKARDRHITLEEMIHIDAEWSYNQYLKN
jgi:hypothetical protein